MIQLRKQTFVCLDCEMTGLDVEKDRIIEVAAVRFTLDEVLGEMQALVMPDCPISEEAQKIHNITMEMLEGKPKIEEVLPSLFDFVGKTPIVGHVVNFDLQMIGAAAKRAEIDNPLARNTVYDTLRLARHYGDSPNNSLSHLAEHFNVSLEDAHRAMNDVQANIAVFKHLVARFKTVGQIDQILDRPIKMKYMPLGKYKGRLFSELPLNYLYWAAKMDFDQDLLYSLRLEIKKRKKGGGFAQSANPFSEL